MSQIWTALGHAMWRVEAKDATLLFDPILSETYHDGVFRVVPERTLDPALTRTGVIAISHRHPDHFDVESLSRLAQQDSERLVVSPDPLVLSACRRLGFRWVREWAPGTSLSLGHLTLVATPSKAPVKEWGAILLSPGATAWNMVDADAGDPAGIPVLFAELSQTAPQLREGLDLLIARWQPLQQVAAVIGSAGGFPRAMYARELERVVACRPKAVVPGASGTGYADPHCWLSRHAYPVAESRFLRDVSDLVPSAQRFPLEPGLKLVISDGTVSSERDPRVQVGSRDPRTYAPFEIPPLQDPVDEDPSWEGRIEAWLESVVPQIHPTAARWKSPHPVILSLCVVFSSGVREWNVEVTAGNVRVSRGERTDWDARVEIAASGLVRILDRISPWGRVLLSGQLRASNRAYRIDGGLQPLPIPAIWLYLILPYERVFEEWVEAELRRRGV